MHIDTLLIRPAEWDDIVMGGTHAGIQDGRCLVISNGLLNRDGGGNLPINGTRWVAGLTRTQVASARNGFARIILRQGVVQVVIVPDHGLHAGDVVHRGLSRGEDLGAGTGGIAEVAVALPAPSLARSGIAGLDIDVLEVRLHTDTQYK